MYKYLYIYNYAPHEKGLCALEFRQLFNEPMISKYYFTNQFFDYQRSVFMKGRLDIMMSAQNFQDIVDYLEKEKLFYYDFRVTYLKNEITHVDYQESLEKCRQVAEPIDGTVDMNHPKTNFAITKIEDIWYFGIYHDEMIWNERYEKPQSYSHSLNNRDARTLVNLAVGHDLSFKVIDPCCGVGTVVLEALSMGIDIEGYDINRDVSYQARMNLEHFGYDPEHVQRRDMQTIHKHYDVTIMDIPYGVYTPFSHDQQMELLHKAVDLSPRFVLVSHIIMDEDLKSLGYDIIDQASITKGSFQRYITLCFKK